MRAKPLTAWFALALRWCLPVAWAFWGGATLAQSLRDPTVPPVQAGLAMAAPGADAAPAEPDPVNVIVRNGKPFVVVGTRLFSAGQMLGRSRIVRIGETDIWLSENGVVRKVPRFAGIVRRLAAPQVSTSGCAGTGRKAPSAAKAPPRKQPRRSSRKLPQIAPCAAIQPGDSPP